MTESGGVLFYLVFLLVVFVVVFVIMFIGFSRSKQPRRDKQPVVGTDNEQSATDPQKLHYRASEGAMDEDVGSNLEKVPQQVQQSRREER